MKRSTFQGFRQYPGNARPHSLSNCRNNFPNTRFRSPQDLIPDLDLEISTNQLNVIIVTAWVTLQTIASDVRTEVFLEDNQIKVGEIILEIPNDTQTTELILDTEMTMLLSAELISQSCLCIQIYRQGIINRHQFGGSHFQRNFRPH